mmetsp:Transcript_28574/g.51935  ORF Transcript_28574/g.51935 Transcript_28574/m.51935 type:complete len:353 (-) Transcript_28574:170-1228(-)
MRWWRAACRAFHATAAKPRSVRDVIRKCSSESASSKPAIKDWCNPSYIVHFGNVVALLAVSQSDMLYLRSLLVVSTCCGMAYNLTQPTPLWAPAAWGIVFLGMHLRQIHMLLKENEKLVLSTDEEALYEKAFMMFGCSPRHFKDLLCEVGARWCTWDKNTLVQKQGDSMEEINYLVEGTVLIISASGDPMHTVQGGKGGWLGEMYDPNQSEDYWDKPHNWPVSFKCMSDQCRTVAFTRRALHEAFRGSPKLEQAATRAQISDLWGKLHGSLPDHRRNAYEGMLQVALSDGYLDPAERRMLEEYRQRHKITEKEHQEFLAKHGWSVDDFTRGHQATVRRLTRFRSFSGLASAA